jgi:hypothetical protein
MVRWLKKIFGGEQMQTVDDVMKAYAALIEKYPLSILDIST